MSTLKRLEDSASLAESKAFLGFKVVQHQVEISMITG